MTSKLRDLGVLIAIVLIVTVTVALELVTEFARWWIVLVSAIIGGCIGWWVGGLI